MTPTRTDWTDNGKLLCRWWVVADSSAKGWHEIAFRRWDGDRWSEITVFEADEMHLLPADAWDVAC